MLFVSRKIVVGFLIIAMARLRALTRQHDITRIRGDIYVIASRSKRSWKTFRDSFDKFTPDLELSREQELPQEREDL